MEKIASFQVDHMVLSRGLYLSRADGDVMTYDIRCVRPNTPPFMPVAAIHTFEHLGATFLRNTVHKDGILYFGPMGCRTGFYLLMAGDLSSRDIVDLMQRMFIFIRDFEGEVPGACARDCGNYLDMNLNMAKYLAGKYYAEVLENISEDRLVYPE